MTNFESIYAALFTAVSTVQIGSPAANAFVEAKRLFKNVESVGAESKPALYQVQTAETPEYKKGIPYLWILSVDLYIHVDRGGERDSPPSQVLNPVLGAVRQALLPARGKDANTLGGLCAHCAISGQIEIYEGANDSGNQVVAVVPVQIKVPADYSGE